MRERGIADVGTGMNKDLAKTPVALKGGASSMRA